MICLPGPFKNKGQNDRLCVCNLGLQTGSWVVFYWGPLTPQPVHHIYHEKSCVLFFSLSILKSAAREYFPAAYANTCLLHSFHLHPYMRVSQGPPLLCFFCNFLSSHNSRVICCTSTPGDVTQPLQFCISLSQGSFEKSLPERPALSQESLEYPIFFNHFLDIRCSVSESFAVEVRLLAWSLRPINFI